MPSAYPGEGNIQILIKQVVWNQRDTHQTPTDTILQVEEIVLHGANIFAVAEYLRQQAATMLKLNMSLFEEYNREGYFLPEEAGHYTGMEVSIVYAAEPANAFPSLQSQIAQGIMATFRDFLAGKLPVYFDPIGDLWPLNLKPELEAEAIILSKQSPQNDVTYGTALVRTHEGNISIVREKSYLRVRWVGRQT